MTKRIYYIDTIKGFAILLVVIGHIIQFLYSPQQFDQNYLFRLIYSFHMPLFFLLSGYVTNVRHPQRCLSETIKNRLIQLVIPFVVWGGIFYEQVSGINLYDIFLQPDAGLWFLLVLFDIYIIQVTLSYVIIKLIPDNRITVVCIDVIVYVVIFLLLKLSNGIGGLNLAFKYYPYYAMGIILKEFHFMNNKKRILDVLMVLLGMFFFSMSYFWFRFPSKVPENSSGIFYILNESNIYHYSTAIVGCMFLMLFFHRFFEQKNQLTNLGKITMSIYILNYPIIWLIQRLFGNVYAFDNMLMAVCVLVSIITISVVLHVIIIEIPIINTLLLGHFNKKQ